MRRPGRLCFLGGRLPGARDLSPRPPPLFAVKGFVTHWLQAQDSCLASDRGHLILLSHAVKQGSYESSVLPSLCLEKNKL